MRQLMTILMSVTLFACTKAAAPPPAEYSPSSLAPYQIFRSAEFVIAASDAMACSSRQISQQNLAQNFVIGDLESVNRQFPNVRLASTTGKQLYTVMSLINNDDTKPEWIVTAEEIDDSHSLVSLANGGEQSGRIGMFEKVWAAILSCDVQTP